MLHTHVIWGWGGLLVGGELAHYKPHFPDTQLYPASVKSANTSFERTVISVTLCSTWANFLAGHFPALCLKNPLNACKLGSELLSFLLPSAEPS